MKKKWRTQNAVGGNVIGTLENFMHANVNTDINYKTNMKGHHTNY